MLGWVGLGWVGGGFPHECTYNVGRLDSIFRILIKTSLRLFSPWYKFGTEYAVQNASSTHSIPAILSSVLLPRGYLETVFKVEGQQQALPFQLPGCLGVEA